MERFGPFRRHSGPTGVPADHFPPGAARYVAHDHRGRVTALVAHGPDDPTVDDEGACLTCHGEEHFGATGGSVTDKAWDGSASRFTDEQYKMSTAACDSGAGTDDGPTVKQGCFLPHHEPGGAINENGVHAAAQRISALKGHDAAAVEKAKAHLRSHYTKDLKEDAPKSIGGDASALPTPVLAPEHAADVHEELVSYSIDPLSHAAFDGTHSHAHSAYGSQGGDESHEHSHSHSGDSTHGHTHGASLDVPDVLPATDPNAPILSAELAALVADPGPGIPEIVSNPGGAWHAYLCVEGIRTDDGREIAMGATQFPDLPVSMRFLKEDEGGHWGAITCGRIDTMTMQVVDGITVCYATGVFGSDKPGQEAQLSVEEQTQRFVSIDPRDVEGEYIEVQVSTSQSIFDDDDNAVFDGWFRMTSFVIGAATIVPIPALQQAVITMADQPLPLAPLATERAQPSIVITADGAPMTWSDNPPAEWFSTPVPTVGDSRLVRQPDGKHAVPLTVTEEGRIYGHGCYWGQEHTGMPGRKVTPPRSATYAHFQTGERVVTLEDGSTDRIAVGKITMGVGHPALNMPPTQVKAHYDGGYGAVQIADVRCVEDDFGIWISGALCPAWSEKNPGGPTPEQVAQFLSLDLSPDWRKVAGKLHMLALLAVPVGGFPVARESLVASGLAGMSEEEAAGVPRAGFDGDEIVAMVAAGRVHRMPMSERVAQLERVMHSDELTELLTERRRDAARARLADLTS